MTTYRERIETIISELRDIKKTIPTDRYTYDIDRAIKALDCTIQEIKEHEHKMINQSLILSFGLPGLNEMINVARGNRYASAKQKKKYTKLVEKELIAQHCIPDEPLTSISVNCIWTESGRARDPDNIRVGIKYVLDAMVNTGVLKDDSMKYVKFLGDTFQKRNKRMIKINWEE